MSDHVEILTASRVTAFATLGVMGVTQDLARTCIGAMEGADPEVIAEETLVLVSVTTARAIEVGLQRVSPIATSASEVVMALPYAYREYLVGGAMIAQKDPELADANQDVVRRLDKKMAFYQVHFPPSQLPGQHALSDKMPLWMGRISPPGMPDMPTDRLERLELLPTLLTHVRLVLAYARKEGEAAESV